MGSPITSYAKFYWLISYPFQTLVYRGDPTHWLQLLEPAAGGEDVFLKTTVRSIPTTTERRQLVSIATLKSATRSV